MCWTPVIEALAGQYDIIAPDARGHGLTDGPEQGYSAADHVADAAAFIQALKLDRPAVLGHSMGGAEATLLAASHPKLVRARSRSRIRPGSIRTRSKRRRRAKPWPRNGAMA